MPVTPVSTVIEIFYPGGFAHDYEWTARARGMRHFAIWNDTCVLSPPPPSPLPPPASLIRARRRADAPPARSRTPISSTRTTRRASRGRRSQCTARTSRSSSRTASTAASRSPLVDTPCCAVPCTSLASACPRTAVHRAEPPRARGAGLYPPSARASSARAVRKYIRSTTDRPTRDAPAHARGTHTRFDPFAPPSTRHATRLRARACCNIPPCNDRPNLP